MIVVSIITQLIIKVNIVYITILYIYMAHWNNNIKLHVVGLSCSCKDFKDQFGFGNCQKDSLAQIHGGKKACYVKLPSSCHDLHTSGVKGEKMSAEACHSEGIELIWEHEIFLFY